MDDIIGRKNELSVLKSLITSKKSEFVAVYGRRRVGKTFLIRSAFDERFTFNVTGIGNAKLVQQLANFHIALKKVNPVVENNPATDWFTAFQQLGEYLENDELMNRLDSAAFEVVKTNAGASERAYNLFRKYDGGATGSDQGIL